MIAEKFYMFWIVTINRFKKTNPKKDNKNKIVVGT